MEFLLLLWKCSSPGPGTGNIDIPIGILMILGCVSPQKSTFPHKSWNFPKFYNFQENLWISWISWFSLNILICSEGHLRIINIPKGISTFSHGRRGKLRFQGETEIFRKFRKFTEILGSFRKCRNSVKTRKAETAAGPPNWPPTRPRWGALLL